MLALGAAESGPTTFCCHFAVSIEAIRAHNCLYEPRSLYARKEMLHRFSFANFSEPRYPLLRKVSDPIEPEPADAPPMEEVIGAQALSVDLRVAVMACLSGGESRRWTVLELVERFKNLGIRASRAGVTAA
jgi:hypothetical protein